jgi:hypothetical protein
VLLALVAALALALPGCARLKEDNRRIAFEHTSNGYREAIRWGYFHAAAGFLAPDARDGVDPAALDNVRVTGYEVVRPAKLGSGEDTEQLVQIDYVLRDSQRLRKLLDRQRWRYDDADKAWYLRSGLPAFSSD